MKYKAIALDLDGTLKSTNKEILPETKKILLELSRQGIAIILASGRPTPGLFFEAKELELDQTGGYLLSFNGARVVNYPDMAVMYEKTFNKDMAHLIYDRAKQYQLAVMTYDDSGILTEDNTDCYVNEEGKINRMTIQKVASFKQIVHSPVHKLLLTGEPEYVASIIDEFKEPFDGQLSIYRSAPFFIEVMANGIDKAYSLDVLLKKLNIEREELIAFGDGYNDLSMIEYAGMGVAMANAVDEVKQRANYVTDSNDEEGIANCLKKLQEKGEI